jgi:transcriptional activator HAC1
MDTFSSLDVLSSAHESEILKLTVSPAETTLQFEDETPNVKTEEPKPEVKKPTKKRKSWGQELPIPKTNLPPRKRAKTEDEKEQRRIERVLRNRAAAQTSRERKRLEVEKLEGEKLDIERQNEYLLHRLAQMEAENNRLSQQVAQLSAEIRSSRGTTPQSVSVTSSPTLAPTLFKQEGDELSLDKIPFPTPSMTEYSPSLKALALTETSDLTQHPAAMLCDLQCQLEGSQGLAASRNSFLTPDQTFFLALQIIIQHLYLTMTSAAYSAVILPMIQIFHSLKEGSPLSYSTVEIRQRLPLILWLISTPSLSSPTASTQRSIFRIQLLTRLLACSPALARPLRDATSRALQLVASGVPSGKMPSRSPGHGGEQDWALLLTVVWAIDCIERSSHQNHHRESRSLATSLEEFSQITWAGQHFTRSGSRSRSSRSTMGF